MRHLAAALILATLASSAYGKPKAKEGAKKKPAAEAATVPATHREGALGAAGVVGVAYGGAGFGAHGWYGLGKLHAGADVLSSSAEVTAEGEALLREYLKFSAVELGARARYFFMETFNVSGGLNYASVSGDYGFKLPDDSAVTAPFDASLILLKIGVGNLWTIGDVVLGADWAVFPAWLSSSIEIEEKNEKLADGTTSSTSNSEEDRKRIEEALRKRIQLQLLMVHAGIVF